MALYNQTTQTPPTATGLLGRAGPGLEQQAKGIIGEAGAAGVYSPYGSQRQRMLLRRRIQMAQDAMRRRTQGASQLYGLDPMAARGAMVQSDIAGNQGTANALNDAEYGFTSGQNDWLKSLFANRLDAATQERIARENAKAQAGANTGSAIGSLAGVAAHFIPGYH